MASAPPKDPSTPALPTTMKAVTFTSYGGPEVLHVSDVPVPVPGPNEALVRVRAACANSADSHVMRGKPYLARLAFGFPRPRAGIVLGNDFAGTVEATGDKVTTVKTNDRVFGEVVPGAYAEFVRVAEDRIAPVPDGWTFEQAATLPTAGLTALQALRDCGKVSAKKGTGAATGGSGGEKGEWEAEGAQRILVNGGSGGVGHFAVQLAKALTGGASHVTAVCSARNADLVRSLGADVAIDYATNDYTQPAGGVSGKYDVIFDTMSNHSFDDNRRVMTPNGRYVPVGGSDAGLLGSLFGALVAAARSNFLEQKAAVPLMSSSKSDLLVLKGLAEQGKIRPAIERSYEGLEAVPEAVGHVEGGHVRGKVVIKVAGE